MTGVTKNNPGISLQCETTNEVYKNYENNMFKHVQSILYCFQAPKSLLKQPLSALVEYLVNGYEDDLSKLRVIYRWITAQPIDQLNIPKKEPAQSHTLFQLWRIKHRKGNYAQLVSLLCRLVFSLIPFPF